MKRIILAEDVRVFRSKTSFDQTELVTSHKIVLEIAPETEFSIASDLETTRKVRGSVYGHKKGRLVLELED